MAVEFEKLQFTKNWNNSSDFPTYEENEAQVRADMQVLHDEVKNFINDKLIPGIEGMAVPGAGDMLTDVYDPTGLRRDVYAYARSQANAAVGAATSSVNTALASYDETQVAKFEAVNGDITEKYNALNVSISTVDGKAEALKKALGPLTLLKEFRSAGSFTVTLPSDTAVVYALAIGAGGGGQSGGYPTSYTPAETGGAGGAGGNALFIGPILPQYISNLTAVVGAGGASGVAGGASSVFGLTAQGGVAGGGTQAKMYDNEVCGPNGGTGGYFPTGGTSTRTATEGAAANYILPVMAVTFSASGGGGSADSSTSGAAGGVSGMGSGGKGGSYGAAGNAGGQCCGGGGGGGSSKSTSVGSGGKGGDGYVAIWIQRTGGAE